MAVRSSSPSRNLQVVKQGLQSRVQVWFTRPTSLPPRGPPELQQNSGEGPGTPSEGRGVLGSGPCVFLKVLPGDL